MPEFPIWAIMLAALAVAATVYFFMRRSKRYNDFTPPTASKPTSTMFRMGRRGPDGPSN